MATPRDVLNELRWRHHALEEALVWYLHRGAPEDRLAVPGTRIRALHRSFFEVEGPFGGTMIPYHRVLRIERDGRPVWQRGRPPTSGGREGARASDDAAAAGQPPLGGHPLDTGPHAPGRALDDGDPDAQCED